jgi:hypothetical protein
MQNVYYIWSSDELLGFVKELNYKTALQKAKLIARYSGKTSFYVTLTLTPNKHLIAAGSVARISNAPHRKSADILKILQAA